jgi:hypothetical protein
MFVASSAFAAAGALTPTIDRVSETVTFSGNSQLYVAFTFKWQNTGGNTINNVTATFSTSVVHSVSGAPNPYGYTAPLFLDGNSLPTGCTKTIGSDTEFSCTKQLKAGESFPSDGTTFTVFYKSPSKAPGDLSAANTYSVKLDSRFVYAERESGNNPVGQPSTLGCSNNPSLCPSVGLGTNNPTFVRTALPKSVATLTLTTGDNAVPSPGNHPFAAKVDIPTLTAVFYKPATVDLDPTLTIGCEASSGQLKTCRKASVEIEEFSTSTATSHLVITFRFAASEITGKPVRPESIIVQYSIDGGLSWLINNVNNNLCTGFGTTNVSPRLDQPDTYPCVAKRVYYKNQSVPGYTAGLAGVVELVFFVRQNGNWTSF